MIRNRDLLTSLADYDLIDIRFLLVDAGKAFLGVNAIHSNKNLVKEHSGYGAGRSRSNQRKPCASQMTAGHKDFDILPLTQLHGDINGVGYYLHAALLADVSGNEHGGGACRRGNSIPVFDQFSGGERNAPLFFLVAAKLLLKGRVVPKWFIEQGLDERGTARGPPQQVLLFK
jgi:hypothetical protein